MRWLSPFSPRITVINGSETKKKSMASFSSADILRTGTTTRALQLKMFKKKRYRHFCAKWKGVSGHTTFTRLISHAHTQSTISNRRERDRDLSRFPAVVAHHE